MAMNNDDSVDIGSGTHYYSMAWLFAAGQSEPLDGKISLSKGASEIKPKMLSTFTPMIGISTRV